MNTKTISSSRHVPENFHQPSYFGGRFRKRFLTMTEKRFLLPAWLFIQISFLFFAAMDCEAEPKLRPQLGEWRTIATDPDLGELSNPDQQPVDFAIWQAAGGAWQLWHK